MMHTAPESDMLLASRPAAREDVLFSAVGNEAVIFDQSTQQMHRLDATATLVWQLLDGEVTLDQTCQELAEGLGADLDQVRVDVVALVGDLASRGLLLSTSGEPAMAESVRPDDVPAPEDGFWVPMELNGCVETVTRLGWPSQLAVELEGRGVGIRAGSDELGEQVRRLLGANARTDVDGAFPNLSIRAAEEGEDGLTLARLYTRCTLVGRSKNVDELFGRLAREAEAQVWRYRPDGLRFHGAVLEVEGGAVLAPEPAWARLVPHERSLAGKGVRLIARDVLLDAEHLEVVLPASTLDLDTDLLSDDSLLAEQGWPIRGWLMETGQPSGLVVPPGRALMIAQAALANAHLVDPEAAIAGLTRILEAAPHVTYVGEWRTIVESARDCVTRV